MWRTPGCLHPLPGPGVGGSAFFVPIKLSSRGCDSPSHDSRPPSWGQSGHGAQWGSHQQGRAGAGQLLRQHQLGGRREAVPSRDHAGWQAGEEKKSLAGGGRAARWGPDVHTRSQHSEVVPAGSLGPGGVRFTVYLSAPFEFSTP